MYVVVALSVPLLALGVEAVARYRRNLVVVPLALLAVRVPANLRALDDRIHIADPRDRLLALANSELLADAPPGPVTPLHTTEENPATAGPSRDFPAPMASNGPCSSTPT